MKLRAPITLSLLCFIATTNAQATPTFGDRSFFTVKLSLGTRQIMDGTAMFEVVRRQSDSGNWVVDALTSLGGKVEHKEIIAQEKDLLSDAAIDDILANCAAKEGVAEVVTVPAGTFQACAIPKSNDSMSGTVWVAKVPFGYIKGVGKRSDGVSISGVLESFRTGPK